jgi:hypothetical protein
VLNGGTSREAASQAWTLSLKSAVSAPRIAPSKPNRGGNGVARSRGEVVTNSSNGGGGMEEVLTLKPSSQFTKELGLDGRQGAMRGRKAPEKDRLYTLRFVDA